MLLHLPDAATTGPQMIVITEWSLEYKNLDMEFSKGFIFANTKNKSNICILIVTTVTVIDITIAEL